MTYLQQVFSEFNALRANIVATCKFVSDTDEVIDGLFKDKVIRFSQPWVLNDPVEVNPALHLTFGREEVNYGHFTYKGIRLPSYREVVYLNLIEARYNRYGILSLTKELFSYDMWNRYANAHKGFIIDFKQGINENKVFYSESLFSGMVKYLERYEIVVDRPVGSEGYSTYDYLNRDLFLNKTDHWKAEREYRIVRPLSEHPTYVEPAERKAYRDETMYLFPYNPTAIASIIFGAAMAPEKKRRIIDLTKGMGIEYSQALVDREDFMVYYLPISMWKSIDEFLRQRPQVFVTDDWEFKYKDLGSTVQSLGDLPYRNDSVMMKAVEDFFRRMQARQRRRGSSAPAE